MARVVVVPDDRDMPPQEKGFLQQVFKGEVADRSPCEWCGGLHQRECRRVKRIVYHPSGERVAEVEFWPDWDDSGTIWPEEVFE